MLILVRKVLQSMATTDLDISLFLLLCLYLASATHSLSVEIGTGKHAML